MKIYVKTYGDRKLISVIPKVIRILLYSVNTEWNNLIIVYIISNRSNTILSLISSIQKLLLKCLNLYNIRIKWMMSLKRRKIRVTDLLVLLTD